MIRAAALACLAVLLLSSAARSQAPVSASTTCVPLALDTLLLDNPRNPSDRPKLDDWARGVGPPLRCDAPMRGEAPAIDEIAVVTWNMHVTHGRLRDLIAQLRAGLLTGRRHAHFILLVQEAARYRDGRVPAVPRGAYASRIPGTDPLMPDIAEVAAAEDLSLLYVPSMRNGAQAEDRGNAILSTLPIETPRAFEMPFVGQRRVGVSAAFRVRDGVSARWLTAVSVHFDVIARTGRDIGSANPRPLQADATIRFLEGISAPAVIGGDFNTWAWGEKVPATLRTRFSANQGTEDARPTFKTPAGWRKMDFLFFRLDGDLCGDSRVIDSAFSSDHRPVAGTFTRRPRGCAR